MTNPNPWHAMTTGAVLSELDGTVQGLTDDQAAQRRARFGINDLPRPRLPSLPVFFLRQFRSPLIYLLLLAGLFSLGIGDRLDAFFIFVVLIVNALIGCFQEQRAAVSAEALRRMIRQIARVQRNGAVREMDAVDIVPGDIVEIESGMCVPADIRLLSSANCRADESLLTGESLPVAKSADIPVPADAGLGDRPTMLHTGTTVDQGRAVGIVVETGVHTALGRIAASLSGTEPTPPPLILRLNVLSRQIAYVTIALIALLMAMLIGQGMPIDHVVLLAIALAVSAIPEGLPVAVTVALATATRRMAQRHVIVRELPAVEGLGSCTLIASDKTGTLTRDELAVERVLTASGELLEQSGWRQRIAEDAVANIFAAAIFCNEAGRASDGTLVGDSVDITLLKAANDAGVHCPDDAQRNAVQPYEPVNRFAAVRIRDDHGDRIYVKGAIETVAAMCEQVPAALREDAERLAADGFRVLAFACGDVADGQTIDLAAPARLRMLGCVGLFDPLRDEAIPAIESCRRAGIGVRMITGDHPATALTIARRLGLAEHADQVITGREIAALGSDEAALARAILPKRVFARIEPEQKLMIVRALAASGEIVAVTGDGVNDAPALKAAHIGVAMGCSGTDVARGAADLILTDDNFASIAAGIEEGRITYSNIRKIIIFLLATGASEIGMFLGALLSGLPMPLTAVQLLWLNLVTNGAQDVMLGFGRGEGDEMDRPPRSPREPLVDGRALALILPLALAMTFFSVELVHWLTDRGASPSAMQNAVLLLTVLFQNVFALSIQSERRPFHPIRALANPWLLLGVGGALMLHVAAMLLPPLQAVLGTRLPGSDVLTVCLLGAVAMFTISEATKAVVAHFSRG